MKLLADAAAEQPTITPEGAERRLLSYGGSLMTVEFRFAAGVTTPLHSHPHEQIGYVVSGELDLLRDGQAPQRLRAGWSYYMPPHVLHGIVTYAPTIVLDCFTPLRDDFR